MRALKQKKAPVITLLLIAAVVVIAVIAAQHSDNKSTPSRTAQVTITDHGFVPNELVVKKGTKVTWTNADSKGHSVGANPYPDHSSLKALVSDALIEGQNYSYTFTKSGTFHYHDDLNPTLNASIDVQN